MSHVLEPAAEPLIARLPSLSPRLAAARERVLSALSRAVDGLTLKASILDDGPETEWVVFDTAAGRFGLAEAGEGADARDHAEVLAGLDRLEPLLAALESSGLLLEPIAVEAIQDADLFVGVEAFDAGGVRRHAAVLALDLDVAEAWPDLGAAEPDLFALAAPLPAALTLEGPTVTPGEAPGVGDIVLLPFGPDRLMAATLVVAGRHARGAFSPARGGFSVNSLEPSAMSDLAVSATVEPPSSEPAAVARDLPVTLRVALGEVTLTAAQLAGLRPGSTVTLDVPPANARAVLLAGQRPVASGRLVALGEAYGLVIDDVRVEA